MRAGVVAVLVGVVLAFGAAQASAKSVFPDLPGLGALERLTDARAPSVTSAGTTTSNKVTATDRVPAPSSVTKAASDGSVTAADKALIQNLPGGKHLPVLGVDAASAQRGSDGMLLALAFGICVLFTRFLFRLNSLGRPA